MTKPYNDHDLDHLLTAIVLKDLLIRTLATRGRDGRFKRVLEWSAREAMRAAFGAGLGAAGPYGANVVAILPYRGAAPRRAKGIF